MEAKLKILRKGGLADPKLWARRGNEFLDLKNYESVSQLQVFLNIGFWAVV